MRELNLKNPSVTKKRLNAGLLIFFAILISFIPPIWQSSFAQPAPSHLIQVTFDNIRIWNNHDASDGEWHFWVDVRVSQNGCIVQRGGGGCAQNGFLSIYLTPGSGIDDAGDERYAFVVPERDVNLLLPENGAFSIVAHGFEEDSPVFGDPNDGIGVVTQVYRGPEFGHGYHDELSKFNGIDGDSDGDYSLRYYITRVI